MDDSDFVKNITTHDIIGLGETWLNNNTKNALQIKGYCSHSVIRQKQIRGGISILFKKDYKKGIQIYLNEDMLWCRLDKEFFQIVN